MCILRVIADETVSVVGKIYVALNSLFASEGRCSQYKKLSRLRHCKPSIHPHSFACLHNYAWLNIIFWSGARLHLRRYRRRLLLHYSTLAFEADSNVVNVLKGQITSSEWNSESHFDSEKDKNQFRRYEEACDRVKTFYKEQHGKQCWSQSRYQACQLTPVYLEKQTVAFNLKAREDFKKKTRARMGVWQAIELLNTLVDDSDPDVRSFSRSFRFILTHAVLPHYNPFHTAEWVMNVIFPRYIRQASPKSSISCRQRRRYVEMGNRSGCRYGSRATFNNFR